MIRYITLHGEVTGSARLNMMGLSMEIRLSLRGKRIDEDLIAFVTDGKNIKRVLIKNGASSIENTKKLDFRGIIIANEMGEFIAEGACGINQNRMTELKASIRMMGIDKKNPVRARSGIETLNSAASSPVPRSTSPSPMPSRNGSADADRSMGKGKNMRNERIDNNRQRKNSDAKAENMHDTADKRSGATPIEKAENSSPGKRSSVIAGILDKADYLFHGAKGNDNQGNEIDESNLASSDEEAVQNPFPHMFPNSYWKRKIGDKTRMSGIANVRGVKYQLVAVRSASRHPPMGMGLGRNIRRLKSKEGKWYWVGINRIR